MSETKFGKINSVRFGQCYDRPFLFGIFFDLSFDGYGASFNESYNISPDCKWSCEGEKRAAFMAMCEYVNGLLNDAMVNYVDELKGKPIEVTVENHMVKSFRILTEVL